MLLYDPKRRMGREARRVVEIADVEGRSVVYRNGKLDTGNWKSGTGCRRPDAETGLLGRAAESFGLSMKEMAAELARRRKLLLHAGPEYAGFFSHVQKELYGFDERVREDDGNDGGNGRF
jgi:hypothetical protein